MLEVVIVSPLCNNSQQVPCSSAAQKIIQSSLVQSLVFQSFASLVQSSHDFFDLRLVKSSLVKQSFPSHGCVGISNSTPVVYVYEITNYEFTTNAYQLYNFTFTIISSFVFLHRFTSFFLTIFRLVYSFSFNFSFTSFLFCCC